MTPVDLRAVRRRHGPRAQRADRRRTSTRRRPDRLAASTWSADREVIPAGALANLLQLHRDAPAQWDAWDIDTEYRRVGHRPARRRQPRGGRPRPPTPSSCGPRGRSARRALVQDITAAAGQRGRRDRHRRRLARAAEAAQARVPARRARGPVGRRDPVRARLPPDAHQHVVGRGPVRDLRAPLGARRRARLRRRDRQRLHLRPRHHRVDAGGSGTTVRLSLLRAPLFPDPEADQGHHRLTTVLHPGAGDRRRRRGRLPDQPARAGRARCAHRSTRWSPCRTRPSWSSP